jgi:MarR family transcriptional regulator, 2-MHQ and catechol-resistance regulon repressor
LADDEDLSGTHIHLVLMRAHRAVGAHALASFASMELGSSDFRILEALLNKGPQLVNDIGRRISLTSGSITTAVDRLEERGLVERAADPRDARARIVSLTREGKTVITKAFTAHKKKLDALAAPLTKAERQQLLALLKKLGRHAESIKPE